VHELQDTLGSGGFTGIECWGKQVGNDNAVDFRIWRSG
jgi:hypothetical protein